MKNQHVNNERKFQRRGMLVVLAMLITLTCCFALTVSATSGDVPDGVCTSAEFSGLKLVNGFWTKTYDGETAIDASTVTLEVEGATDVTVTKAQFDSKDVESATSITVWYTWDGNEAQQSFEAKILPRELTWGDKNATASVDYDLEKADHTAIAVAESADTLSGYITGLVGEDSVKVSSVGTVSVSTVGTADVRTFAQVSIVAEGETLVSNYTVANLPVVVSVKPIVITDVIWDAGDQPYVFTYGDDGIYQISAKGVYGDGKTCALNVMVKAEGSEGSSVYTLKEAYDKMLYGGVKKGESSSTYVVYALIANEELYTFAEGLGDDKYSRSVKIEKAMYDISISDVVYIGEGDLANSAVTTPILYQIPANGVSIPAEVLAKITYQYYQGTSLIATNTGVSLPGVYTVKVVLPEAADGEFENYGFTYTGDLSATMTVLQNYITIGIGDKDAQLILFGEQGISADQIKPTLSIPESISRKALRGFHVYEAYTLKLEGAQSGEKFKLVIPVNSSLLDDQNCHALTVSDLYLYDGMDTLVAAEESYTVTFSEDGSYYVVEGLNGNFELTFVIAPAYDTPFWFTAPGIALIILLVLLVLVLLFLIGLKLRQIEKSGTNPILVIDTEGDVPEFQPVVIADKIDDPDACLEESIDDLAEALRDTVEADVESIDEDVDASVEVSEAMDQMLDEAAEIELTDEAEAEDLEAVNKMTEEMAENAAEALKDTAAADDTADVDENEVNEAVADAMAKNFNESADAVEAIALVEEDEVAEEESVAVAEENDSDEDDDDSDDDDDDDASFGGFGSMPLTFIDAVAEAEQYNDMLARESRGEIRIVTRYRRSYQSRMAQSQGSVQDYYNEIKNLLLSYKGVKSRISWNYEAFNLGRTHLAKFNAKTRTLYIYMALNPEELADSKYTFKDMSSKKKYASVPVLMKVKGDRKFKHALELIVMLCEEKLGLQKKKVVEEVDYKVPYKTTEELVNDGTVKKLVAAIPLNDQPIEEAPVEEAPVEEAPIEEAHEEDVSADAEVSDEEPKNV
ncbi:MAG: hypothetical protein IJX80_00115 [Clostridia bacterium]|nr:hypothetical protein [Clostridia bacterium]